MRIYEKDDISHSPGGWLALLHRVTQGSRLLMTVIYNCILIWPDFMQAQVGGAPFLYMPHVCKGRTGLHLQSVRKKVVLHSVNHQRGWSVVVKNKIKFN